MKPLDKAIGKGKDGSKSKSLLTPRKNARRAVAGKIPAKMGRPTTYRPEYAEWVIELGRQGKSLAAMAGLMGLPGHQGLTDWARIHEDFSAALTRARTLSQLWWEELGQTGAQMPAFNGAHWINNMRCRFREDWKEVKEVQQTNEDGPNRIKSAEQRDQRIAELFDRIGTGRAARADGAQATGTAAIEFSRILGRN